MTQGTRRDRTGKDALIITGGVLGGGLAGGLGLEAARKVYSRRRRAAMEYPLVSEAEVPDFQARDRMNDVVRENRKKQRQQYIASEKRKKPITVTEDIMAWQARGPKQVSEGFTETFIKPSQDGRIAGAKKMLKGLGKYAVIPSLVVGGVATDRLLRPKRKTGV